MLIINKKLKGFTLLELIVVIAIIAILAVIAVPSFTKSLAKARDAKRVADIRIITDALYRYQIEYGGVPVTWAYESYEQGGLDISSKNGFLTFLKDKGILNKVPVDPINDYDGTIEKGYTYWYFCFPEYNTIVLHYTKEINDDNTFNTEQSKTLNPIENFKCLDTLP